MNDDRHTTDGEEARNRTNVHVNREAASHADDSRVASGRETREPTGVSKNYGKEARFSGFSRRGFLGAAGVVALGATVPVTGSSVEVPSTGSSVDQSADRNWIVEQGEECWALTPLRDDASPGGIYDWDEDETDYSSLGTRSLQERDTSILFLYEDGKGDVYLVLVHGKLEDDGGDGGDGGSVTFTFRGLPDGGEWVVRDDFYDGPTNYDEWDVDSELQSVDWTWHGGRTDGGVYGPLDGDDVSVSILPQFNDEAELYERHYDGEVDEWMFLSGSLSDPDLTPLDMDDAVRIRTGQCGDERRPVDISDERRPVGISVDCDPGGSASVTIENLLDRDLTVKVSDGEGEDLLDGQADLDEGDSIHIDGVDDGVVVAKAYHPGDGDRIGEPVRKTVRCQVTSPLRVSVCCDVDDPARVEIKNTWEETIEVRDFDGEGVDAFSGCPDLGPDESLSVDGVGNGTVVLQAFEPGTDEPVGSKIERTVDCKDGA